jgi:hypothetical protein
MPQAAKVLGWARPGPERLTRGVLSIRHAPIQGTPNAKTTSISSSTASRREADQRFRRSEPMWSPPPESSRRPHPYHGTTGNRCADARFPRSRPTVGAEVIGSPSAKLCVYSLVMRRSSLEQQYYALEITSPGTSPPGPRQSRGLHQMPELPIAGIWLPAWTNAVAWHLATTRGTGASPAVPERPLTAHLGRSLSAADWSRLRSRAGPSGPRVDVRGYRTRFSYWATSKELPRQASTRRVRRVRPEGVAGARARSRPGGSPSVGQPQGGPR